MKRNIITINEEKCTGCGQCIPNCAEGAIQMIDGKARLVSDLMCDGLGACLGHCPEGAITLENREAQPYDERQVMATIVKSGPNTIAAHLTHLKDHGQMEFYRQGIEYLSEHGLPLPVQKEEPMQHTSGCPGSRTISFAQEHKESASDTSAPRPSHLGHWPIQMHLISPMAPHYRGSDMVLAADCTAFSLGDFHQEYLKGKTLAIACPKLDEGLDIYTDKIIALIDDAGINTLTVMIMQVPCCGGLLQIARAAAAKAKRKIPVKCVVVALQGTILKEEWV